MTTLSVLIIMILGVCVVSLLTSIVVITNRLNRLERELNKVKRYTFDDIIRNHVEMLMIKHNVKYDDAVEYQKIIYRKLGLMK